MPAYRFCRTDDIPFLVDALNACYVVHFADQEPLTIADFKAEIRDLNVWASSCMAVWEDEKPIGVVIGAKREHETLIHRIGVHPDFQRRGHARHLLESLSHKLSVLGPPKLVTELSDDQFVVRDLFESVGYGREGTFADFVLTRPLPPLSPATEVARIELADLQSSGVLDSGVTRSWERALTTLQNRKDQLEGLAIASDTRVEAYALFRDLPEQGRREIVALGGMHRGDRSDSDSSSPLECLIRVIGQAGNLQVTIPKISCEEIPWIELESMGFRKAQTYTGYAEFPGSRMH
jgi:GNAT superfamily N-acetyltransferase